MSRQACATLLIVILPAVGGNGGTPLADHEAGVAARPAAAVVPAQRPAAAVDLTQRLPATSLSAGTTVTCDGDGQVGKRVQLLVLTSGYRGPIDDPLVVSIAAAVDAAFLASAQETGGTRHVRFVHQSTCVPVILGAPVSSRGFTDFNTMVRDLKQAGHHRSDRKYLVFGATGCGLAQFENDDTRSTSNRNNSGPHFAMIGDQCKNAATATHELAHILGAVNDSAPHATGGGHCVDEYDRICYQDGRKAVIEILCPDTSHEALLDCNHDDYFSTNPPAGSYLATHWNVANSSFLIGAEPLPVGATPTAMTKTTLTHGH